jgi:hypothetical protein
MSFGLIKHNNNSISAITTPGSLAQGKMTLIKEQTASSSSSISFVHGSSDVVLDSTYPIYLFKFINLNPATDDKKFQFNLSADTGSNYNVSKTSTYFSAYHNESGSATSLGYRTGNDLANGTGVQVFTESAGNGSDESAVGELILFNPSSTTFVKHFIARTCTYYVSDYVMNVYTAGYANTTSAIDAIQFSVESGGNFDGTIKLYGIKDS